MLTYRLKCKKYTGEQCYYQTVCGSKKIKCYKRTTSKRVIKESRSKTTLNEISLSYDTLFQFILRIK